MAYTVQVEHPESMNLMGLLMAGFLEGRVEDLAVSRKAEHLRGAFGIATEGMSVHLRFEEGGVRIAKGLPPDARAVIEADLHVLLDLVSGAGFWGAVARILSGKIAIRGNPISLLSLMPILMD